MPQADRFEAPQGSTFHGALLQAVSEAFVGNGIQNDGDAKVSVDVGMTIDVDAATGLRYAGDSNDVTAASFTLSDGPGTSTNGVDDRRVDLIYYDDSSGSYAVSEGDSHPNPQPPSVPSDGLLIALVLVEHAVTSLSDDEVLNWRSHPAVEFPVEQAQIATDAVGEDELIDGSVATSIIQDGAVDTSKLADGSVDTSKLADDSVTASKIDETSVTTTVSIQDDGQTIEAEADTINFGSGLNVTSTSSGTVEVTVDESILDADPELAQSLARRSFEPNASQIESASGVSARKAQVLARRNSV